MTSLDSTTSKQTSTGHVIILTRGFKKNPICTLHGKHAIICEPPDEIGGKRWFCIDCVANAIYERRKSSDELSTKTMEFRKKGWKPSKCFTEGEE